MLLCGDRQRGIVIATTFANLPLFASVTALSFEPRVPDFEATELGDVGAQGHLGTHDAPRVRSAPHTSLTKRSHPAFHAL